MAVCRYENVRLDRVLSAIDPGCFPAPGQVPDGPLGLVGLGVFAIRSDDEY